MRINLEDISDISTGVTFRSRLEPEVSGGVRVIQMKDLGTNNRVNLDNIISIHSKPPKESNLIKKGDIIFRARGQSTTAVILDTNCHNTIVAAPLLRIRVTDKNVLPEYLLWYINQPSSQAYFMSHSEGTLLKMINKKWLGYLKVDLPSIKQQRIISGLYELLLQELQLLELIKKKREEYIQGTLMKLAS
jgi:restriction endonuclease S subunit